MRVITWMSLAAIVVVLAACGGTSDVVESDFTTSPTSTAASPGGPADDIADLEVRFETGPDSPTQAAAAIFVFSAPDALGYECSDDAAAFVECESPALSVPATPGTHTFAVRAIGADGTEGTAATWTWTQTSVFEEVHADLVPTAQEPSSAGPNSWRGIFRVNCDFAHSSYDDPIVAPGDQGATHLHRFYGNTLVDHDSTMASLYLSGESTCQGNVLNLSAYWVPALLAPSYDDAGNRITDENGAPAWEAVPAVVGNDDVAHEIFYYSAGVDDLDSIQAPPAGLRIIAGDASTLPGGEQATSMVRWHCQSWESNEVTNPRWSTSIPDCVAPDRLRMDIFFPSCWNGVDLDSEDHQSHMAYPIDGPTGTACPESHPVPIARVSYHYAWAVRPENYDPVTRSSHGWRLASDAYEVDDSTPGGLSLHGDWFNAWHPEVLQAIVDVCIAGGLDCHDGNLGNGYRLSGTREGTQVEPPVIAEGMGTGHNDHR